MKSFLFLPLLLLAVLFTSCRKEEITQVNEVVIPNRTITTTIQPGDWQPDAGNKSYFVSINMPEIDQRVHNTNGVLAYFSFDDGVTYEAIPDVFFGTTLQVTHSVGKIFVDFQNADGSMPAGPLTEEVRIKIVLVESDPV